MGGLVIDFHSLMENIQQSIVGTDSIARLNSLYNINIDTGVDALETLAVSNEKQKARVTELKKTVTGTTKPLLTNANKLNSQKSLIGGLTRRLAKLEK